MSKIDLSRLSDIEYRGVFNDWLNYFVRKTFLPNERLMFITYQPKELTLDYRVVSEHTYMLFGAFRYVEVLEQTYLSNNLLKSGHLIDGYHSHILIKESDYLSIKDDLKHSKLNIVGKFTYNLNGLTDGYLLKQAGVTYNRVLPTQNIPIESEILPQPYNAVTLKVTAKLKVITKTRIINVRAVEKLRKQLTAFSLLKINTWHRYIDDT